jgi:hypothetical protein
VLRMDEKDSFICRRVWADGVRVYWAVKGFAC